MNSNSDNPKVGKAFQCVVKETVGIVLSMIYLLSKMENWFMLLTDGNGIGIIYVMTD